VVATHRPGALQKGLSLEFVCAPDLPEMMRGDAIRLGQNLHNLVSNAVKFTERGFVRVVTSWEAADLPGKSRVTIAVEDSGIGIDPADHQRVFTPFEQAWQTSGRRFDGTGLGLSIARALVELQVERCSSRVILVVAAGCRHARLRRNAPGAIAAE
jgi:signal transduction histidine kinase